MSKQITWTGQTTDETPTILYQANSTKLTLVLGDVFRIQGTAVAIKTATTSVREWEYSALIKYASGGVELVGSAIVTDLRGDTGTEGWTLSVTANNTDKSFDVTVTGQHDTTIDWNVFGNYGDTSEVIAPTAPTLKTQIDSLIGSGITAAEYNPWVEAGARTIVDILKPEDMQRHSSEYDVPSSGDGLDVVLYRIWRVLVGGNYAIQRDEGQLNQVVDSNSFYKASAFTPAYIIKAGLLKCYAVTRTIGKMIGIKYPTGIDTSTATEIEGVPENLHYAVVLYAAIQGRIQQLTTLMKTTLAGLIRAAAIAPTALSAPSFTYTTNATTIGSLGMPPTYIKPSIGTLPSALAITDLDITSITIPPTPVLSPVTYIDATGATVSATTIGAVPSAPAYVEVTPTSEIATAVSAFNAQMTLEDIELARPQLDKISTLVQEYQTHVQEHLGAFNGAIKKFEGDLQKVLNQSQITMQEALEQAKLTTDVSMQNKIQAMTALVQNNNSLLQKYQDDVAKYSQQVNALVSQHQSNTQSKVHVYTNNVKTVFDTWTLDIQNELNKYNKELAIYQATVQAAIKDAEFALQKALQDGNQNLAKEIQQYDGYIKKYNSEIQKYQTDVQNIIQGFQADVARTVQEHAGMLAGQQQLQSEYHSLIDLYLGRQTKQPQQDQNN